MNGTQLFTRSGWDNGAELSSTAFTLPQGLNTFVFLLREGTGGNQYAVRFTDNAGVNLTDLSYRTGGVVAISDRSHLPARESASGFSIARTCGRAMLNVNADGPYVARIMTPSGKIMQSIAGNGKGQVPISAAMASGVFLVRFERSNGAVISKSCF